MNMADRLNCVTRGMWDKGGARKEEQRERRDKRAKWAKNVWLEV